MFEDCEEILKIDKFRPLVYNDFDKALGVIRGTISDKVVKEMDTNVVIPELKKEMTQEITLDDIKEEIKPTEKPWVFVLLICLSLFRSLFSLVFV